MFPVELYHLTAYTYKKNSHQVQRVSLMRQQSKIAPNYTGGNGKTFKYKCSHGNSSAVSLFPSFETLGHTFVLPYFCICISFAVYFNEILLNSITVTTYVLLRNC